MSIKISELPDVLTPLTGLEMVPVVQDGHTRKAPLGRVQAAASLFSPEMFGAVGDADFYDPITKSWYSDAAFTKKANDDFPAFKAMFDAVNFAGGGHILCAPQRHYWLNRVNYNPAHINQFITVTHKDGRTTTAPFFTGGIGTGAELFGQPVQDTTLPLFLLGVDGFQFDGNGSKIISKGDFHLFAGQNTASWHDKTSMIPFWLFHVDNVIIKNVELDGEWRKMTLESGSPGQALSMAFRLYAVKNCLLDNIKISDWMLDGITCGHRFVSGSPGLVGDIYPETINDTVYETNGRTENLKLLNVDIDHCGRQGMSPVGVNGFRMLFGSITFAKVCQSPLPKFKTGDPPGVYQVPGPNPGFGVDFEPDRNAPNMVTDVKFIGTRIFGNAAGIVSILSDAGRTRGEKTFLPAAVNVATDVINLPAHGFPNFTQKQRMRVTNTDGTLPAGLSLYTDVWLTKLDADNFKLSASYDDALDLRYIDLTTQGTGTHRISLFDTLPCIDSVEMIECELDHPSTISAPIPIGGQCPNFRIVGGSLTIRYASTTIEMDETSGGRYYFSIENCKIRYTHRWILHTHTGGTVKSGALPGIVNTGTDTINIPAHGYGNYDYDSVYFAATTLPTPLENGTEYFIIKVDNDNFKLAFTLEQAKAGVAIDLTAGGAGTLSVFPIRRNTLMRIDGCDIDCFARERFFPPAAVDVANNRINILGHDRSAGESVVFFTTGTLPAPLLPNTIYFLFRPFLNGHYDDDYFCVAANQTDANNEVAIDLLDAGTGMHEIRNSNTGQQINMVGPGLQFTNNTYNIPFFKHSKQTTNHRFASFQRMARSSIRGNTWTTDLRSENPARSFEILATDMPAGAYYAERKAPNIIFTPSNMPTYDETDGRQMMAVINITPVAVAANTTAAQAFTVAGLKTTDSVVLNPNVAQTNGLLQGECRVSGTDTLQVRWGNFTAGSLTPAAGNYRLTVMRNGN